jgi:hypothetical protein
MLAIVSHLNWRQNSFGTILSLITSLSHPKDIPAYDEYGTLPIRVA